MQPTELQIEQAKANIHLIHITNYLISGYAYELFDFKFVSLDKDIVTIVCEHKATGRTISFSVGMIVLSIDSGFVYGVRLDIDGAFHSQFGMVSLDYGEAMKMVDKLDIELVYHANLRCSNDIIRLSNEYATLHGSSF